MSENEHPSDHTENAAAIRAGERLANVDIRIAEISHPDDEDTAIPVVLNVDENGPQVELNRAILDTLDARLPGPRRRVGTVRLVEMASLILFVNRYGDDNTVIYADPDRLGFVAVIDDTPAGAVPAGAKPGAGTAWRQNRASYDCPRSPEWLAWTQLDGQAMKQEQFADFLESRLEDMTTGEGLPKPIDVLAVARSLHIKTKGEFRKEVNPTNGDHILVCKTETDTGSTAIPRAFLLAIPVFVGGERYQVEARIRFALVGGVPAFSYTLHRRKEIERDAFDGVRAQIAAGTSRLMLAGTP